MGSWIKRGAGYSCKTLYSLGFQIRCKTTSAQYVAQRTRDPTFENFMDKYKHLRTVALVQTILLGRHDKTLPLQYLSRLQHKLRLKRGATCFLKKYPHIFHVYKKSTNGNIWFSLSTKAMDLVHAQDQAIKDSEQLAIQRLLKLLMISPDGTLPLKALVKGSGALGLPDDFEDSVISNNAEHFRWIRGLARDSHRIGLVSRNPNLAVAAVDTWRKAEYTSGEMENDRGIRFGFKHQYPPEFRINRGYRDKVKIWQRLSYWSPYEDISSIRIRSKGGFKRLEKRAVAILHEFLSLTVEKMVEVEQISHFRKPFNIQLNIRDLFLDHPGIFYLSTKGNVQTVFLREAYRRGKLIEPNPIYLLRRKMLDLVELGRRGTLTLETEATNLGCKINEGNSGCSHNERHAGIKDKGLKVFDNSYGDSDCCSISDSSEDTERENWNCDNDSSDCSET